MKNNDKKQLILDYLSNEPEQVIALAYLYAKNMYNYGVDVTKEIDTATRQTAILERAYTKGRNDERLLFLQERENI